MILATAAALAFSESPAWAQSLDERLDEDAFLRGLIDQGLPEVLEHYMQMNPPDDPVRAAQFQIAAQQLRLQEASTPGERLEAVEQLIALREALLDAHPDHSRRSLWLADQAADLFFQLLPMEASGITCLFGVPTRSQRDRARHVAEQMQTLATLADLEVQGTLMEIEAEPDFNRNEALQMQRRRIVRDERERRIPFLRGVAAVLAAELVEDDPEERALLMEEAASLLTPLCQQLEGVAGVRACLYAGLANLAVAQHEQSASAFLDAAKNDLSPIDAFAAKLGQIRLVQAQDGDDSALQELEELTQTIGAEADPFQRILLADQRFLLKRDRAMELTGGARREALKDAFETYLDLLDDEPDADSALSTLVFEKLATAVEEDVPLDDLPVIVTIARAQRLADDPQRSAQAVALLEPLVESEQLDQRSRTLALFALGRALYLTGRWADAAERFLSLARDYPTAAEADRSIELAATAARQLSDQNPEDADARALLRRTLEELVERYPNLPTVDSWRYVAGRLAMDARDHELAVEMFRQIGTDSTQWPDARFMLVTTLISQAAATADEDERRQRHEDVLEAADRASAALQRAMEQATPARRDDLAYYLSFTRVLQARALAELGQPAEALEALEAINTEEALEPSVLAAALRTRIAAHRALGQSTDAQQELARFLQSSPREAAEILAAMLGTTLSEIVSLEERGRTGAARERAGEDAVPLAHLAFQALPPDVGEPTRTTLLRRAAEAYRYAGRYGEALEVYARLLRDHPDAVELVFGRAESLYGSGGRDHLATAMTLYRQIAASGRSLGEHHYWQSQLRMLQILDQVQRNTDKIVPRIKRLREEDRELGGARYRSQFDELYNKYASRR